MTKKKVVVTSGDPAGCGPFISLKAIQYCLSKDIEFSLVGDKEVFKKIPIYRRLEKKIKVIDLCTPGIEKLKKGQSSKLSGQASLSYLDKALKLIEKQKIKRLVTAPLSKEAVGLSFPGFSGHTEYLADFFRSKDFAMMMASSKLITVLLTRHMLLRDVSSHLKIKNVLSTLSLVYEFLRKQFKIRRPKIAFASFNPHAGINTFLEREERIITRAILKFNKGVCGPYPSDTIFTKQNLKNYACIICPYHDQAMLPFKLLSLREGVNVTLGLPIVRTSPSHGVAYDIIRNKKTPFHTSMLAAIKLALKLSP